MVVPRRHHRSLRSAVRGALVAGLLAGLASAAAAQLDDGFHRQGDRWVRVERGQVFLVDPSVVSLRFTDHGPVDGDRLSSLHEDPELAGVAHLRSNRLGIHDLKLPAGADPLAVVEALRRRKDVEYAETNTFGSYTGGPADPDFGEQWNLSNTGQAGGTPGADVNALSAWALEDGDPSVVVAVIDSGTDWAHPDLYGNVWSNPGEVVDGLDNDGNGLVDDIHGWDYDGGDNDPSGLFFHGTFVAGCVAAVGQNDAGIVGLAGGAMDGAGCRLLLVNVGNFAPSSAVLDDALVYAADEGVDVITLSLAVGSNSSVTAALAYAVGERDVFVDCAAGNFGSAVSYPAMLPDVMAVASTDRFDVVSGFSNPGPQVEVAAPGSEIRSTSPGGGYTISDGTSFAAPHVGALAALLRSFDPTLTAAEVRAAIRDTAVDVGAPGVDEDTGHGRVDARAALEAVGRPLPGAAEPYGEGLAGTGGLVPTLETRGGLPFQGNDLFGIVLEGALPGAPAFGLVSLAPFSAPFEGGTLLVDLTIPSSMIVPRLTNPSGQAVVNLPLPPDPNLVGLEAWAQFAVVDPEGIAGYAFTAGLHLTIGG